MVNGSNDEAVPLISINELVNEVGKVATMP